MPLLVDNALKQYKSLTQYREESIDGAIRNVISWCDFADEAFEKQDIEQARKWLACVRFSLAGKVKGY